MSDCNVEAYDNCGYQRGNRKQYTNAIVNTQKQTRQKWTTKQYKDWVTPIPLKPGVISGAPVG